MIKIENLKLSFPGRLNLSIDKLLIEKGKIFTVIGPNGAGKSTLLNIFALFQKPDSGAVEIGGENILSLKDRTAFRRGLSFVFSRPYLFNDTVYNNVALPLKLRGARGMKPVDEMLALFNIARLKENKALTLSQGEMRRVALARAFVTKPEIVLLDEPFLSLDARFKESLMNELRGIIKFNKITALFVTQDQIEALNLADIIAVMINGRILQYSSPEDIFTKPVSK